MIDSIFKVVFCEKSSIYMELLKVAFQAVVAVGIFFGGIVYERHREKREQERTLGNIREILREEMIGNYGRLIRWMPIEEDKLKIDELLSAVSILSSSVYREYLDRLCELTKAEIQSVYKAYLSIEWAVGRVDKHRSMVIQATGKISMKVYNANFLQLCEETLNELSAAIVLFEDGQKALEELRKERGKGSEWMAAEEE